MDTVVSASGEPLRQNSALDTAAGDVSRQNVIRNEHLGLTWLRQLAPSAYGHGTVDSASSCV